MQTKAHFLLPLNGPRKGRCCPALAPLWPPLCLEPWRALLLPLSGIHLRSHFTLHFTASSSSTRPCPCFILSPYTCCSLPGTSPTLLIWPFPAQNVQLCGTCHFLSQRPGFPFALSSSGSCCLWFTSVHTREQGPQPSRSSPYPGASHMACIQEVADKHNYLADQKRRLRHSTPHPPPQLSPACHRWGATLLSKGGLCFHTSTSAVGSCYSPPQDRCQPSPPSASEAGSPFLPTPAHGASLNTRHSGFSSCHIASDIESRCSWKHGGGTQGVLLDEWKVRATGGDPGRLASDALSGPLPLNRVLF